MNSIGQIRLVITGAPASGKTKCWLRLQKEPEMTGWVFFEELARKLLSEEPQLRHNRTAFHQEIYQRQVNRESSVAGRSFVSDRGTVDAFAFHPETMESVKTSLEQEYDRYDAVILLGSTAALGNEYYKTDDIRSETVSEALEIEEALVRVWSSHPQYISIDASKNFEDKYSRLKQIILRLTEDNN